jgi:hypothetical protein
MTLADFWPTEANIRQCIKPEAESDWDEVFLAIHQPMRLVKRAFKKDTLGDGTPATETDFLREFLKEDLPTGTLLMPILGDSGTGKSHLVRWLDVQLKRRPDADRRHVIRIPKSSSLKTVLYHILEDLQGEQYDEIRRQLRAARERLDVIGAEERILGELRAAIRRRYNDACQNREDARSRGEKPEQIDYEWYTHGNPERCLPALLSDPETSRLFMAGTGTRPGVISQLAKHLTTDSSDDRPPRRNFEEADMEISGDLDISRASQIAKRYLESLDRLDGRERKTAVRLLNSIIDSALQPLASPTDTSLSEMFLQIRRHLLADGRELILLVEDFAVLSGIQGALLDAMIREGVRGGVDACVMRTALAVTAGYDFGRYDTVKTRAVYGWHVDESPVDDDDKMVARICDYVGAYLNAARFGSDSLKQRRSERDNEQWPPHFGDNSELDITVHQQLLAFGHTQSGWMLFPFNEALVRQWSDLYLRDANNQLRFNPRTIINHLLIHVLRDYRAAWISGEFPAKDFLGPHTHDLSASLHSEVRNAEGNGRTRERYLALLRYWGDCPDRLAEVVLPREVYEAFGLKPLIVSNSAVRADFAPKYADPLPSDDAQIREGRDGDEPAPRESTWAEPMLVPATVPETVVTSVYPEEVRRWEKLLNNWNPSSYLTQNDANELRLLLFIHIQEAIDWDSLFLRKLKSEEMKGWHKNIFLPYAKGTNNVTPANAMCTVCPNELFACDEQRSSTILALIAVARHEHYKHWDYPEAYLDYAYFHNLLERLVPHATEWILRKKYHDIVGDPIPALVGHLLLAARLLDVRTSHESDFISLLSAIFEAPPTLESLQEKDEWAVFRSDTAKHHLHLQDELLSRTAVRQGGAGKTYGVDCVRILDAIRTHNDSPDNQTPTPDASGSSDVSVAITFAKRFSARLSSLVRSQQKRLAVVRQQCLAELGEGFDKSTLVAMLTERLLPESQRLGLLGDHLPSAAELQSLCEAFLQAPVSETLRTLATSEHDDFLKQVSSLAQIDNATLGLIERFVRELCRTVSHLEDTLEVQLTEGEGMLNESTRQIEGVLNRISQQLKSIRGAAT